MNHPQNNLVLQAMLKQIKWNLAEYFKHPPPIGTRVKIAELKIHQTGTVFCHIEGGKGEQSKLIIHQNLSPNKYMYVLVKFFSYSMTS